jgi:hypothetical protein
MKAPVQLKGEIRYAIQLAGRTARCIAGVQTVSTFFSILGGSTALAAIADNS